MKEIKFLDQDGQKRKGYEKQCEYCNKKYIVRKTHFNQSRFCSAECRNKGNESGKTELNCPVCDKKFTRLNSSLKAKSNVYFCCKQCKNKAAKLAGGIEDIWPRFYGNGKAYRKLFVESELKCDRCGYNEFTGCIEIHHKDGNHRNNKKTNLQPLCPTCHKAKHRGFW